VAKRVFFSFHYQDVIDFRANVVRNHKTTKHQGAGYFDASIWEDAKKESDLALKRLINRKMKNTSVTAVLIGSKTYSRRWVKYEIMNSLKKGNVILGIHINSIPCRVQRTKESGNNPFDYLGINFSTNGQKLNLLEYKNNKWVKYGDLDGWSINGIKQSDWGKSYKLSKYCKVYDWVKNNGYSNFNKWIE